MKWRLQYWFLLAVTLAALPFMVVLWFGLWFVGAPFALWNYYCKPSSDFDEEEDETWKSIK
jgi:hypothetical protein